MFFLTYPLYLLPLFHMTKQTQQLILMLVIGIFIGTAAVKAFSRSSAGDENITSTTASTTGSNSATDISASEQAVSPAKQFPLPPSVPANSRVGITVLDQAAGRTVLVSAVSVTETSWVAIYEEKDGKPGSILGAQKVNSGDKITAVELLRPEGTLAGGRYFAAILPDDGDGQFNRLTDLPPFSPEKVVIVSFIAR